MPRRRPHKNPFPPAGLSLGLLLGLSLGPGLDKPAVAEMPPGHFGNFLAGQFAQSEQRVEDASDFLAGVLDADPDYTPLTRQAFILTMSAGHWQRARDLAVALPDDSPEYALAQTLIALDAFRAGSHSQAARIAGAILDQDIGRFTGPVISAWAAAAEGEDDRALAALEGLAEIGALRGLGQLQRALLHDYLGEPEAARAAFEAIAERPSSARSVQYAAAFFDRTGAPEKALAILEAVGENSAIAELIRSRASRTTIPPALTAREGLAEALLDLSGLLRGQRSGNLHLILARLAVTLAPQSENARFLLAEALRSEGADQEAIEVFASIDRGSHLYWLARQQQALSKERLGQAEAAEEALRSLIDQGSDRLESRLLLGNMLNRAERFEDAVAVYRAALRQIDELAPRHWTLMYSLGMALERLSRWAQAEEALLTALELNPDQPLVLNYLGYSWADQGQNLARAEEMIEKAVKQRPHDGFITDSLGWVQYRRGRYQEAVVTLEKAVILEPDDAVINDHLGDAYWRVGRYNEARFQWQRAARTAESDGDEALLEAIDEKLRYGLDDTAQAAR